MDNIIDLPFDKRVVAIDYDNTISLDPEGWCRVFAAFKQMNFEVICVTYRTVQNDPYELDWLVKAGIKVYFTGGQAKRRFLHALKIKVDVWIDDMPETICLDINKMKEFPYP